MCCQWESIYHWADEMEGQMVGDAKDIHTMTILN
jgi:hypothetical protein